MKPKITFKCKNENCADCGKEVQLRYHKFGEDYWTAKHKLCPECDRLGELVIHHGDRNFSEIEIFEEYIVGLANEANLLKKLVDRGVAEEDEKEQFQKSMKLLTDAKCPCCWQPLIDKVEG